MSPKNAKKKNLNHPTLILTFSYAFLTEKSVEIAAILKSPRLAPLTNLSVF